MTKHIKEITSRTEYSSDLEQFLQSVYTLNFNRPDEQMEIYGTDQKARFYHSSLVEDHGWVPPAKAASYVMLNFHRDRHIADIGCGTGAIGKLLQTGNYTNVDGYDLSPAMTQIASPYYKSVKVHNVIDKPLDSRYDAITATGVFTKGHLDASVLPNLTQSLRPNGELVVTFPLFKDYDYEKEAGWKQQDLVEEKFRQVFDGYTLNNNSMMMQLVVYKLA